jgi:hypothetical protein
MYKYYGISFKGLDCQILVSARDPGTNYPTDKGGITIYVHYLKTLRK